MMLERKTVSQCISSDYCAGWNDAVDAMPKWISVEERLPKTVAESNWDKRTENVLAIEENGNFYVGRFYIYKYDGAHEFVSGYEHPLVTHWMPLPSAEGIE